MPIDYAAILREHGFSEVTDELCNTITAFDYEVNGVLFDDDSPFDMEKSDTRRHYTDLNCMLSCSLVLKPGRAADSAVGYLVGKWFSWLRYQNPEYENIERITKADGVSVHILTIASSGQNACSIGFDIKSPLEAAHE